MPKHRIHVRWAIDLENPAPTPAAEHSDTEISNLVISSLALGFSVFHLLFLLCVILVCYPLRNVLWSLAMEHLGLLYRYLSNLVLNGVANLKSNGVWPSARTVPLASEGREDAQAVQDERDISTALVLFIVLLTIVHERGNGATGPHAHCER